MSFLLLSHPQSGTLPAETTDVAIGGQLNAFHGTGLVILLLCHYNNTYFHYGWSSRSCWQTRVSPSSVGTQYLEGTE